MKHNIIDFYSPFVCHYLVIPRRFLHVLQRLCDIWNYGWEYEGICSFFRALLIIWYKVASNWLFHNIVINFSRNFSFFSFRARNLIVGSYVKACFLVFLFRIFWPIIPSFISDSFFFNALYFSLYNNFQNAYKVLRYRPYRRRNQFGIFYQY